MANRFLNIHSMRNIVSALKHPGLVHSQNIFLEQTPILNGHILRRNAANATVVFNDPKESFLTKLKSMIPWPSVAKTRLKIAGYLLYDSIVLTVDYNEWFKTCDLPDTFLSWFIITELHVWLMMVRCNSEDKDGKDGDGKFLRNQLVTALWADVNRRVDQIGSEHKKNAKQQVPLLGEQFRAALIGYDEGLVSLGTGQEVTGDMFLAGAIWRRIFMKEFDDAVKVENIIRFIRKQLLLLDQVSSNDLQSHKMHKIKWLSLNDTS